MLRLGNSYWLAAVNSVAIAMVTFKLGFVGTHSLVFREMKKKEREGKNGGFRLSEWRVSTSFYTL